MTDTPPRNEKAMANQPTITLNNGVEIPQVGFGVYQIAPDEVRAATEDALSAGYRHIDTAAAYQNEAGVGEAVRHSGIPREELFVTTKLRNADQGYESTLRAFDQSRKTLGLDVIDLYLIHWPYPSHDRYVESWKALESLYADGSVRAIGVSNFLPEHLERILAEGSIVPAVNQIEVHPTFQQAALTSFAARKGIATESYSPLGQGADLSGTTVVAIAERHGVTPAQVVLRWHMQLGLIVIPKSVTPERVRQNLDVLGFSLSREEMKDMALLESGTRLSGDPATFDYPQL